MSNRQRKTGHSGQKSSSATTRRTNPSSKVTRKETSTTRDSEYQPAQQDILVQPHLRHHFQMPELPKLAADHSNTV